MKKAVIALLIIILVVGCMGTSRNTMQAGDENYRVGTNGLTLRFLPFSPPDRIFDDEELRVRLEVFNKGATDISGDAMIYLSGFDPSIITGIGSGGVPVPDLEGKKFYRPEGDFDTVEIIGMIRDLQSRNIDVYEPLLLVTACYRYETIADPEVCIDPDPFSTNIEDKVCDWRNSPAIGTQGAPIAVNHVEVEAQPSKTRFKIFVSNVGGGTVLRSGGDTLDRCNPYDTTKLDYDDIDYVHVDQVMLGDSDVTSTCRPLEDGELRLRTSGSGFMICEVDTEGGAGAAYTTPLVVSLSYNYRDTISKQIKIIQTP
jgi:hypothetical protein